MMRETDIPCAGSRVRAHRRMGIALLIAVAAVMPLTTARAQGPAGQAARPAVHGRFLAASGLAPSTSNQPPRPKPHSLPPGHLHNAGPTRSQLSRTPVHPLAVTGPKHIFTVNSTSDTSNLATSNTAHICKDANGKCTLRAAIDAGNADTGADEVKVPAGTFTLSLGVIYPMRSMLITGAGAAKTILDGANKSQIFSISNSNPWPAIEVDNVTLQHGSGQYGGAMYLGFGTLILGNDILTHNVAAKQGGAVTQGGFDSSLWMVGSTVSSNTSGMGGGLYLAEGATQLSNDTIGGTTAAAGNKATVYGGGIYNGGNTVSIINTHVDWNSVVIPTSYGEGGGIVNASDMAMQGGSISHNTLTATAGAGYGGGLYNGDVAQFTGVAIDANSMRATGSEGGGFYNYGYATFDNSAADNNTIIDVKTGGSDSGGGVSNESHMLWQGGSISGNTIKPGSASAGLGGYGGGLYEGYVTTITGAAINDNTITGRTALSTSTNAYSAEGGGVYSYKEIDLSHDSIDRNTVSDYNAYSGGVYLDSSNELGATGLDIGKNQTIGVVLADAGALYAYDNFTLTNSTIHDNTVTVTEPSGGSIQYGVAYFGNYASLDGVTIKNQINTVRATSGGPSISYGIAYFTSDAHLVNVSISGITNTAKGTGGYISTNFYFAGYSELTNVSINAVTNAGGNAAGAGGYEEYGVFYASEAAQWDNVSITGTSNSAPGSAAHIHFGVGYFFSYANLHNVKVLNTTDLATGASSDIQAGVLYLKQTSTLVNFVVDHVTATTGRNGNVTGGALYLASPVSIDQGTISDVAASNLGTSSTSVTSYVDGGAIDAAQALEITNVTMSGDKATSPGTGTNGGRGGAVYAGGPVTLTNDTINGNSASSGGGAIWTNSQRIMFLNTILASNLSSKGACTSSSAAGSGSYFVSAGHNLGADSSCALSNIGDLTAIPKLGPLQNNGGFVLTEAELTGSPTIDAGANTGCPSTDARGVTRPQGKGCDIGAYEFVPPKK